MVKAAAARGLARRAAGRARVADRDQARRRRHRRLVLDEGARRVALRTRSSSYRRALEALIPGGVNSPVRAMRAVGLDEPFFVAPRRGRVPRGRRRQPLPRLGACRGGRCSSGTPIRRRSRRSQAAAADGTTLRRADRARGRARRGDRRRGAVGRAGAARLLGHRGGDERDPARARARRGATGSSSSPAATTATPTRCSRAPAPGSRRSGSRRSPGVPTGVDRRHDRRARTTTSTRPPRPSRSTARGSRRSSSSRSPGTWASSRRRRASSRRCARSATRPARCSSSTR